LLDQDFAGDLADLEVEDDAGGHTNVVLGGPKESCLHIVTLNAPGDKTNQTVVASPPAFANPLSKRKFIRCAGLERGMSEPAEKVGGFPQKRQTRPVEARKSFWLALA